MLSSQRKHLFTASEIYKIISNGSSYEPCEFSTEYTCYELTRDNGYIAITEPPKKGKKCYRYNDLYLTDGAIDYAIEKANAALYYDREEPQLETFAIRYGRENEYQAIEYLIKQGHDLVFTGDNQEFFTHSSGMMGATPDAVELDNNFIPCAVWDIKTPSQKTHTLNCHYLKNHLDLKKRHPVYYWQGLCQMECTNANVFFWCSFAPDKITHKHRAHIIEIKRELVQDDINFMLKCVKKTHDFKLAIIEEMK